MAGSVIALGDVDRVFNDAAIRILVNLADAPPTADVERCAQLVRTDVRLFLAARGRLNNAQLRIAIGQLYTLTTRAHCGDRQAQQLACVLNGMHPDVRQWLMRCNPQGRHIPSEAEIISPTSRARAIERLRLVLSYGGYVEREGRLRGSGRRSRSYKPLLRQPVSNERERRPRGEAERELVQNLALTFTVLTGKQTPDTAHYDPDIQGPFPRFVCRCFDLIGLPTGNVVRLINERGTRRRRQKRRAVQILPVACRCGD